MKTEHPFTLPRGYRASNGTIHHDGVMRLALAGDEILPLEDPRVKGNRAYLVILLLARVITRLGDLTGDSVTPAIIEGLYSADLAYLQRVFRQINELDDDPRGEIICPHCGEGFNPEDRTEQ
jgi:hypothetical protein